MHEPLGRRERLAALTRGHGSRALAPDGARARLGALDPVERAERRRAGRAAAIAMGALALLLVAPPIARSLGTTEVAHALVARAVESAVSSQFGGRLTLGGVDYVDGEHLALHDVRLDDEAGAAILDVDAVELDYDVPSLLAGRLVAQTGRAKGGSVILARAPAHDRDASARTDLVRLDRLEAIHVAVSDGVRSTSTDEHALVRLRVGSDGAVVVDATHL